MSSSAQSDHGDEVKRADARSYAKTAGDFARLTARYSNAVADHLLDRATLVPGGRLVDIGTGSGLVAIKAAARFDDVAVLGIDQSIEMLDQARANAEAEGLAGRVTFQAMDAENLDIEDSSMDLVTSLYVIRHLPNPKKAAAEIFRILKQGGEAIIASGGPPSLLSVDGLKAGGAKVVDRAMGILGKREVSPNSLRTFLDRNGIAHTSAHAAHHEGREIGELLRLAGFSSVRRHWFGQSYALSPSDFWDVQAVFDSEARSRLEPLSDDSVATLRDCYLETCRSVTQKAGRLIYRTGAQLFIAKRG